MRREWVRVLLVEDDEEDYLLTRALVEGSIDPLIELDWVPTYSAAQEAIERDEYDLYLVDYNLGARDGLDLIRAARSKGSHRPFVLLTGLADRRVDLAATAAGAAGFLIKLEATVPLMERTIRYALRHDERLWEGVGAVPSRLPFPMPSAMSSAL